MNIDEYEPMKEVPSEQELATGFVNERNNMNNGSNNTQNNTQNNNNKPNNNKQNNNKQNNNNPNNNKQNNNKQNYPTVPATVNTVNENMNEEEEPISYSREEELIKYGNLNGLEPTNLASRYHNIFEGEQRKRKTRKRKTRKQKRQSRKGRKGQRQSRKGQRQSRKGNARHK